MVKEKEHRGKYLRIWKMDAELADLAAGVPADLKGVLALEQVTPGGLVDAVAAYTVRGADCGR